MRYEFTGVNRIPYISLLSLWSISLVVNLPGLPIYALSRQFSSIFPGISDSEFLLLKILPSIVLIPFVLLSGRLSVNKDKARLVVIGLVIFFISGISYFFVNTLTSLIIVSCMLYAGAGIVIPLSAGMIAQYFEGKYRMKELGVKSAVGSTSLIIYTLIVYELIKIDWRLTFLIYLLPIVPIVMSYFFTKKYIEGNELVSKISLITSNKVAHRKNPQLLPEIVKGAWRRKLTALMFLYFVMTYCLVILLFYLPNKMFKSGMDDTIIAFVISVFFASVSFPGFFINQIVNRLRKYTIIISIYMMLAGIMLSVLFFNPVSIIFCALFFGFSFGILQPIVYDKSTHISEEDSVMTEHLSFVLSMKYLSSILAPFIVKIFHALTGYEYDDIPFMISILLLVVLAIMSLISPQAFVFKVDKSYYSYKPKKD